MLQQAQCIGTAPVVFWAGYERWKTVSKAADNLQQLREQLDGIDQSLLDLVAQRQQLVGEIGRYKRQRGRHLRDFEREAQVLALAEQRGAQLHIDGQLCRQLMSLLIEYSLESQELGQLSHRAHGQGQRALVLGGFGRMGRWFSDFLDIQGYSVTVADQLSVPVTEDFPYPVQHDWQSLVHQMDLIVVAVPMAACQHVFEQLATLKPSATIFDLGSLKSPLSAGLKALAAQQLAVTSVHPLFGPDTTMLSGKHVVVLDLGHEQALNQAKALFENTMADVVTLDVDDHDRLMAYVLSCTHLMNIAFAKVLADSGEQALSLRQISSSSFEAQLQVVRRIADENPQVYYEIQSLNPHAAQVRGDLIRVLSDIDDCVRRQDDTAFRDIMAHNRAYLQRVAKAPSAGDDGLSKTP